MKAFLLALAAAVLTVSFNTATAHAVTKTWTGAGNGTGWSGTLNWSPNGAPARGDRVVFNNAGFLESQQITNSANGVRVNSINFEGATDRSFNILGNQIELVNGASSKGSGAYLSFFTANILAINRLTVSSAGNASIGFNGQLNLQGKSMDVISNGNSGVYIGNWVKGTGTMYVTGTSTIGLNLVAGEFTTAKVDPTVIVKSGGILNGGGELKGVQIYEKGRIRPFDCLTTRNITIAGVHEHVANRLDGCDANKIVANGKVTLSSTARLKISVVDMPNADDRLTIINNDGTDKVVGTFQGKPEGSVTTIAGIGFRITYKGGTGNDVVLRRLP